MEDKCDFMNIFGGAKQLLAQFSILYFSNKVVIRTAESKMMLGYDTYVSYF